MVYKYLTIITLSLCFMLLCGCSESDINSQYQLCNSITFPQIYADEYCNLYPEIDLSEIRQLPVYNFKNVSKDDMYNDIHTFANKFDVVLDENNSYIIEGDNCIQYFSRDGTKIFTADFLEFSMMDQIPDSDYYGVPCNIEYTYDAIEDSIILREDDKISVVDSVEQYLADSNILV